MRFALVGYGRMGREIEAVATGRGHRLVSVIDPGSGVPGAGASVSRRALKGAEMAFEFSAPSVAESNVVAILDAGTAVVCGTTGWDCRARSVAAAARRSGRGAVIAPNFSIGMTLFQEVAAEAARRFVALGRYDPYVIESHHRTKLDAPSGTARRLAAIVAGASRRPAPVVEGTPEGPVAPGAVHVASVRAGHETGVHTVGFDGPHDAVTLTHRARGRSGLALGAVLAAEWLEGRSGVHGFEEVLRSLTRKGGWE